ncbi:hypothetical protein TNCV_2928441 [Trichonephila clavipes]|nr:hypothetical protein TNCV_2928441 [Trichonephila clavipes]
MALRNKDSAMNKMSRCRTEKLAPVHSRRGKRGDCEFRANRTLMRRWAEFCGLSMIKGRGRVARTHPWCLKGFFLEKREKETREGGAQTGWRESMRGEGEPGFGTDGKALEKRLSRDWSGKTMSAGGIENRIWA